MSSLTLKAEGPFDLGAARRLSEIASGTPPETPVVLDLRAASEIQDAALGFIIRSLLDDARDVSFRGLDAHHQRIADYLTGGLRRAAGADG